MLACIITDGVQDQVKDQPCYELASWFICVPSLSLQGRINQLQLQKSGR